MDNRNYDLNTFDGMANSKAWLMSTLDTIKDGGSWLVPRSCTVIKINKQDKLATIVAQMMPDPSLGMVFEAIGWAVQNEDGVATINNPPRNIS